MKKIPAIIDDKDIIAEWNWLANDYLEDNVGTLHHILFFNNHIPWIMYYNFGSNIIKLHQISFNYNEKSLNDVKEKFLSTNENTEYHGVTAEAFVNDYDKTLTIKFWHIVDDD